MASDGPITCGFREEEVIAGSSKRITFKWFKRPGLLSGV